MSVVSNQNLSPLKAYALFILAIVSLTFTGSLHAQWIPSVTFTNPAPGDGFGYFGYDVDAVGTDKVLIGTPYHDVGGSNGVGRAYLFSTNGTLLTTFNSPSPAAEQYFGRSVAAVGTDKVIIGSLRDRAYLFSTNGTLLITFTNSTQAIEGFGDSVAAVGTDKVLIGSEYHVVGGFDSAGAAYLFSTSGTLLTTFTNPTPAQAEYFGASIAGMGADKVLVGAYRDNTGETGSGTVYIFNTSGTLLTTITNPTPALYDGFGGSVAALGTDRLLIGASGDDTDEIESGTAYLYNINGTLLTTFTNPTPAYFDTFGGSVTAVGTDKVLIGAVGDDTGETGAGAAYLFSTNGTLLTMFGNPNPASADSFGNALVAVGADKVLIAAQVDDTGGQDSGAAYLFSIKVQPSVPSVTFTNPTPQDAEFYSATIVAVGEDKVLIGTPYHDAGAIADSGAAYLFSTSGTLLTTFTNPTPEVLDNFGVAVAAFGTDKVLIGAYGDSDIAIAAGTAYLFSTSGTLLTTFTNPTPAVNDLFGIAVAAVGADKVIIGAYADSTGAPYAGTAYLFNTNGTLLTTYTNPTPQDSDYFGWAVAGVGTNRVLISAFRDHTDFTDSGIAYLFDTSGTLMITFTNPTPAMYDNFGVAVAAVGTDKVLIGAYADSAGATYAGAAYLFSTNGTLLTTFTNPTPANSDFFGYVVAAMGTDKVLVGANRDDTGATDSGAAYLFSTNGTLLATFINPTPGNSDYFGNSVAALGTNKVLVVTGWTKAAAAYLFNITPNASLRIFRTNANAVVLAWPAPLTGWTLQSNTNLATANWPDVTNAVDVIGSENQVIISPSSGNKYFRLLQQ